MKVIYQVALKSDGSGIKKWVDVSQESYGVHKTLGRETRVLYTENIIPNEPTETSES